MGNVIRADNGSARIRRGYLPGGLLGTDTIRIRSYYTSAPGPCGGGVPAWDPSPIPPEGEFDYHIYGLRIAYDLDGRRDTLYHPDPIDFCAAQCRERFAYDAATGALTTIYSLQDSATTFTYDVAGRLISTLHPGGIVVNRGYDGDGRPVRRTDPWFSDTLRYDARGRAFWGQVTSPTMFEEPIRLGYSGLAAVAYAEGLREGVAYEEFTTDAIGNRTWRRDYGPDPVHPANWDHQRASYYDAGRRLIRDSIVYPFDPSYHHDQQTVYDESGNAHQGYGYETKTTESGGWARVDDEAISYYGADDKLRVFNRHIGIWPASGTGGVFEEYRYDALGRRVQVRSRCTSDPNPASCRSYIERTVWDGDQILYEIRAPGKDSTFRVFMDDDAAWGGSVDNQLYGRVAYTHSGLDRPATIFRINMTDQPNPIAVVPHANWQGDFEIGSFMDGTTSQNCTGSYGCPLIDFPGSRVTADGGRVPPLTPWWFGNLITGKQDQSGLQYMRNRYYDPKSGRFTQEDPIGLAGGLNLYGFAEGDPVNFSDPFGLNPCLLDPSLCAAAGRAVVSLLGGPRGTADVAVGFTPVLSSIDDFKTMTTGESLAGSEVGMFGRAAALVGLVTPASGGQIRGAITGAKHAISTGLRRVTAAFSNAALRRTYRNAMAQINRHKEILKNASPEQVNSILKDIHKHEQRLQAAIEEMERRNLNR